MSTSDFDSILLSSVTDVTADNSGMYLAWNIVEHTGESLFLTGKAGTGKTTFLREVVRKSSKRLVVLAPTGIAAINAGGVTIHSFFQFPFTPYVPGSDPLGGDDGKKKRYVKRKLELIRSLDLIVIDEISMVRADMLDAIDTLLRRLRRDYRPFGGVQMLFIGDLQQLPPVVTESDFRVLSPFYSSFYFFDSRVMRSMRYYTVELKRVYRQSDAKFIDLLNAIRENRVDSSVLTALNDRYIKDFTPPESPRYIRLTTHNEQARIVNEKALSQLEGELWTNEAVVEGTFPENSFPADRELNLKVGAQVMFIRNDSSGYRRYYNGMLGKVLSLEGKHVVIITEGGEQLSVAPERWENIRYELDKDSGEITEMVEGTFTQFPLRLAWAITIHKSQGLTFSHAIIDASRSFAHGQCYVALSRCRSLEGLVIERPLQLSSVIYDGHVTDYVSSQVASQPDADIVRQISDAYRLQLAKEMFDFVPLSDAVIATLHHVEEAFMMLYPKLVSRWRDVEKSLNTLHQVSGRFYQEYEPLMSSAGDESLLQERIHAASAYFSSELEKLEPVISDTPDVEDSKELNNRLSRSLEELADMIVKKRLLLEEFKTADFTVDSCLQARAKATLELEKNLPQRRAAAKEKKKSTIALNEVKNPELYRRLISWRTDKMKEKKVPAYTILPTSVLKAIAEYLPLTYDEFLEIPGIGRKRADEYSAELIAIIEAYLS